MNRHNKKIKLSGGSSCLAISVAISCLAGAPALAQQDAVSEVVITGSRVIRDGTQAPTPVTVIAADELQAASPRSLAEGLSQLPAFRGSSGIATINAGSGARNAAGSALNLRNIGWQRTLVLLDGYRLVPSGPNNYVDLSIMPEALVARTDVVTGGASAAYGSDAVAGAVNLILDRNFEGLKIATQYGRSELSDAESRKHSVTYGRSLFDGRLHFLAEAGYREQSPIHDWRDRDWAKRKVGELVTAASTGYPTTNTLFDNVLVRMYPGGVILPGAPNAASLANTKFLPGGIPAPYNPGTFNTATNQVGGDGVQNYFSLIGSVEAVNGYSRLSFDPSDKLNIFFDALYSQARSGYEQTSNNNITNAAYTIFESNPFIPAATRTLLAATTPSAACGTAMNTPGVTTARCFRLTRYSTDWGRVVADFLNNTVSLTAGFQADVRDWDVRGYINHGENRLRVYTRNTQHLANNFAAADAVLDTNGRAICNVLNTASPIYNAAVAARFAGCAPMNLFGEGSPSPESIDFAVGDPYYRSVVKQDVAALTISGSAFEGWAGPVDVAFGAEYRKQTVVQVADAVSQEVRTNQGLRGYPANFVGLIGGYAFTNQQPFVGDTVVKEAFAEAVVPLVRDAPLAQLLELNAAARYTHYSRAGGVNTWKLGLIYQPVEDVRFRGTISRDIREPSLNESFQGNSQAQPVLLDPFRANASSSVFQNRVGNPDLGVESADTYALGLVYRPAWLSGFYLSVDWYSISISDAIAVMPPQRTVDECFEGNATSCALITRAGGVAGNDGSQAIVAIRSPYINLTSLETSGADFEIGYRRDLFAGSLNVRALVSYLDTLQTATPGSAPVDTAGAVGRYDPVGAGSDPRVQGQINVSYEIAKWRLFLQQRYIGAGDYRYDRVEGVSIDDNSVPAMTYTNATIEYKLGDEHDIEVFLSVTNLFDKNPPIIPQSTITNIMQTNTTLYDPIGRYYTVGLRAKF